MSNSNDNNNGSSNNGNSNSDNNNSIVIQKCERKLACIRHRLNGYFAQRVPSLSLESSLSMCSLKFLKVCLPRGLWALLRAGGKQPTKYLVVERRHIGKLNMLSDVIVVNHFSHQVIVFERAHTNKESPDWKTAQYIYIYICMYIYIYICIVYIHIYIYIYMIIILVIILLLLIIMITTILLIIIIIT